MAARSKGVHVPTRVVKLDNGDIIINFPKAIVGIDKIIGSPRWEARIDLQGRRIRNKKEVSSQPKASGDDEWQKPRYYVDLYFQLMSENIVKLIADLRVFGVISSDGEPIWAIAIFSQESEEAVVVTLE